MNRFWLSIAAALFAGHAMAVALAPQSSVDGGVTISVKPLDELGSNAKSWNFAVTLDTHSQDLSDDLLKSSTLVDDQAREYKPLAWEGAKPGGHHRAGTLRFAPVAPVPRSVELRIQRPGEKAARVFRWNLGS